MTQRRRDQDESGPFGHEDAAVYCVGLLKEFSTKLTNYAAARRRLMPCISPGALASLRADTLQSSIARRHTRCRPRSAAPKGRLVCHKQGRYAAARASNTVERAATSSRPLLHRGCPRTASDQPRRVYYTRHRDKLNQISDQQQRLRKIQVVSTLSR